MPHPSKQKVYVTFPGVGEIRVYPKNNKFIFGWEYTNEVWRKKLNTELWFVNEDPAPKTFDIFASLELEECGCHVLPMRLTLECETGVDTDLFNGLLYFIDGEWFFDFCSTSIKPRVDDPFDCLFNKWENEHNILEGTGSEITLATDLGTFEEIQCFDQYDPALLADYVDQYEDGCLGAEPGGDWSLLIHNASQVGTAVQVFTTWVRETFTGLGPPAGAGWTEVTPTFWTRPVIRRGPAVFDDLPINYYAEWRVISKVVDNGRLLTEVIEKLFSDCPYPIRSDLLGIDPPGDHPVNSAYTYAQEWLHNAVVFSISDIVRPFAGENATKAIVTLKDLLKCMREWLHDSILFFDDVLMCYRIEHNSFDRFSRLVNFVTMRPDAIRGYNTYTYEKSRIPQKHIGEFSYKTNDADWDGASIIYPECNDVGRIETVTIDCFHTDFGSLVESGVTEIDILKGLMIVAQKDGQIHRAVGDVSGEVKANGGLSWANVFRNFWRWRMPFCNGLVNGTDRTFNSLIPKIKGKAFDAEFCCADILQFHPALDRFRTGLGTGELNTSGVEFDLNSGMATWDILYAPPLALIDLTISISVNDPTQCYYTDFIFQTNESFPEAVEITWDFGSGAIPATATGQGPHTVQYTTAGTKTVIVTAEYAGETTSASTEVVVATCQGQILGTVEDTFGVGIQSVNVKLFEDFDEDGIADNATAVRNVFTNASGVFAMASLTPGSYVIVATNPSNFTIVVDGDVSPDGDVVPNTDNTNLIIPVTVQPGVIDSGNEFVFTPIPGTITGYVFVDADADENPDAGEGIAGVVVEIWEDADQDGVSDGVLIDSTVTDINGLYEFHNVATNTYPGRKRHVVIVVTVPMGYTLVKDIDKSPDGDTVTNSNTTDGIIPCTVTPGEIDANNYFILSMP